jgi:hypothetical protein
MGLPDGSKNGFVEIVFRQDLQDIHDFIFYFQFPDETENTQSPSANLKSSSITLCQMVSGVREKNSFIWKVVTNKRIQKILLILSKN